jgi:CRP/FNR family cyclic AMP-dependent transcriptional regulator
VPPAGRACRRAASDVSTVTAVSARSLFLNAPERREVRVGEVVYREGDPGSHMYGVVEGAIELRKRDAVVARLGPDDVFGERALIDEHPRDLTAIAVEDSVLAEIDRYLFLFLVDQSPTFALDIMGALAARLRSYDNWIASARDAAPTGSAER